MIFDANMPAALVSLMVILGRKTSKGQRDLRQQELNLPELLHKAFPVVVTQEFFAKAVT